MSARVDICGVHIDSVDMHGAIARVGELIDTGGSHLVVTPNVDHVVKLTHDERLQRVYRDASLVLADGMPLVAASRLLGTPLPERVAGSDLLPALCAEAARTGWRVFFMGGDPGDAQRAAEVLTERHPSLNIVGTACPPLGFEHDAAGNTRLIDAIRRRRPDLLLVGLGAPKQELWLAQHLQHCGAAVGIGVGITFSFIAGTVRRAPRSVQRIGLEWAWRLAMEPRKLWRRYLVEDTRFALLLARQLRNGRTTLRAEADT